MNRQQEQPLIGEAPVFLEVLERVSRVAQLNRPVLVIGERGTGKELVAALRQAQLRRTGRIAAGD